MRFVFNQEYQFETTTQAKFEVLRAAMPTIQVCWVCLTLEMKAL
jgi:hypothetical protein